MQSSAFLARNTPHRWYSAATENTRAEGEASPAQPSTTEAESKHETPLEQELEAKNKEIIALKVGRLRLMSMAHARSQADLT